MKIKYIQLESDAFLTDIDFVQFTPAERGVYCSLILYLTSNGGKYEFKPLALSRICNCESVEEFEKIFQRISKKFQLRKGIIRHKRVTKELCKAKKLLQAKRRGGLSTAKKRQHSTSIANSTANAKERNGNVKVSKDLTNTADLSASSSDSLRSGLAISEQLRALHFNDALSRIIPPAGRSDRTCFRNVANWLLEGCVSGRFTGEIFERVLDYAKQARQGERPAAVFMAILKQELGYERKEKGKSKKAKIKRRKRKMNADIMIENVEPAQCRTLRMEAEIKRDRFAQQRAAWECLKFFEQTPATEADFRMKFASMAADDVTLLKAFYNVKTDAELLTMICRFWNV